MKAFGALVAVLVAGCARAAYVPIEPAAFKNVASRTSDLLMMHWFPQNNCSDGDNVANVAPARTTDDLDVVPEYARFSCLDNSTTGIDAVQNGYRFDGSHSKTMFRSKGTYDADLLTPLTTSGAFTLEFFIKMNDPFDYSGSVVKFYPLFEIADSVGASFDFSTSTMQIGFETVNKPLSPYSNIMSIRMYDDGLNSAAEAVQVFYATNTDSLREIVSGAGKTYHVVVTRGNAEANAQLYMNEYTGDTVAGPLSGHVMTDSTKNSIGQTIFSLSTTMDGRESHSGNHVRVMSAVEVTPNSPFDMLYFAFYDAKFSAARVLSHFNGGLPNSKPQSLASTTINVVEDTPTPMTVLTDTDVFFDADGDEMGFFIVTAPTNGDLTLSGTGVLSAGDYISNAQLSTTTYLQTAVDEFDAVCTTGSDSMVVRAWDEVCGGSSPSFADVACHSQDVTVKVCVDAKNDAPISTDAVKIEVREGTFEKNVIKLFANDVDDEADTFNPTYALKGFTIVSQSRPDLGNVTLFVGGVCTDDPLDLPYDLDLASVPSPGPSPISPLEVAKICYSAEVSTDSTETLVGTDVITFRARDGEELVSSDYSAEVDVLNALIAGCDGNVDPDIFDPVPCEFNVAEDLIDEPTADGTSGYLLKLQGDDSLFPSVRNESGRVFVIRSLPNNGKLYEHDSFEEIDTIGTEIVAQQWNEDDTGMGYVRFVPDANYFNQACIGRDYKASDANDPCSTPGAAGGSTSNSPQACDVFGKSFFSCPDPLNTLTCAANPTTYAGCPVKFSYSIGFKESESLLATSSSYDGIRIHVFNVNDDPFVDVDFSEILEIEKNAQPRDKFSDASRRIRIAKKDESDTRMVRLTVAIRDGDLKLSNRDVPSDVLDRLEIFFGSKCLETGCPYLQMYGYPSDLNSFLNTLEYTTTQNSGDDFVRFIVSAAPWEAGVGSFPGWNLDTLDVGSPLIQSNVTIRMQFGEEGSPPDPSNSWYIYAAIFGGAAALGLMVLAWVGTMLVRARQGEKLALWVFNNILCTKVQHKDPEKRDMALAEAVKGADSALEHAIDSEHRHMVEVLWCVHCLACFCPCCIKYDKNAHVPSKEDMMEKALAVESDRIAAKHIPDGAPVAKDTTKEDLEVDTIADDSIFDWERHLDKKTGRHYYYNPVTHESRWSPPEVVVHSKTKKKVVSMRKSKRFKPKPPTQPKEGDDDDDGSDVV